MIHLRLTDHLNFCLLYLVGRWISKTSALDKIPFNPIKGYVVCSMIIFVMVYFLYLKFHLNAKQMQGLFVGYSYSSPFVILQAVFLFLAFGKLKMQNRFVNWCAVSCLSVFLIHMHPSIKDIGYYGFTKELYQKDFHEHILFLLVLMISVFFASILIDKVRIGISLVCEKMLAIVFSWIKPLMIRLLGKFEDEKNVTENR